MSVAPVWSSTIPRPLRLALLQLGVAVVLLGLILIAVVADRSPESVGPYAAFVLVAWLYVGGTTRACVG